MSIAELKVCCHDTREKEHGSGLSIRGVFAWKMKN